MKDENDDCEGHVSLRVSTGDKLRFAGHYKPCVCGTRLYGMSRNSLTTSKPCIHCNSDVGVAVSTKGARKIRIRLQNDRRLERNDLLIVFRGVSL